MIGSPDASAMVSSYSLLSKYNRQKIKRDDDSRENDKHKKDLTPRQMKILDAIEKQLSKGKVPRSELKCPECGRAFVVITLGKVDIECCLYCKSYWFDPGELSKVTGLSSDIPSQNLRHRDSKYHCPVCKSLMNEHIFMQPSNLLVDRCPEGHGVYLEGEELKRAFDSVNR